MGGSAISGRFMPISFTSKYCSIGLKSILSSDGLPREKLSASQGLSGSRTIKTQARKRKNIFNVFIVFISLVAIHPLHPGKDGLNPNDNETIIIGIAVKDKYPCLTPFFIPPILLIL